MQLHCTLRRHWAIKPSESCSFLRSCCIFREQYELSKIWHFIYCLSYLHLIWATQNNLGKGHPPEVLVAQWQSRVRCNCTVLSSSAVQDCFFFSFLCNCFSCFLDCQDHIRTSHCNLSLVDEFSSLITKTCLCWEK